MFKYHVDEVRASKDVVNICAFCCLLLVSSTVNTLQNCKFYCSGVLITDYFVTKSRDLASVSKRKSWNGVIIRYHLGVPSHTWARSPIHQSTYPLDYR